MEQNLDFWMSEIGKPEEQYAFKANVQKGEDIDYPDFVCEYYTQQNGPSTVQRVMMLVPKGKSVARPAVVVPFYFPEAMLGEEPSTKEKLPFYKGIEMMLHLVTRGYIVISAESYHLTYVPEMKLDRGDFARWTESAAKLHTDHPHWSGIGKLVADTQLLLDMLCNDSRVDRNRIGIAGHSLGGKMAFYTGCLDSRVKVIVASDFGILWHQTNWNDAWYWGKSKVDSFIEREIDHASLLRASGLKPFALIAGFYDNQDSFTLLQKAGYVNSDPRLCFIDHHTGHRPPFKALTQAYNFLDLHLQNTKFPEQLANVKNAHQS